MTAGRIRLHIEVRQRRKHGQTHRSDGRLGHIGPAKGIRLPLPLVVGKGRARKQDLPQRRFLIKLVTGSLDGFHGTGKGADEIPSHMGILASLAGKHESDFSGSLWRRIVIDTLNGRGSGLACSDNVDGLLQSVFQAVA